MPMPTISDLKRMLELFPVSRLRQAWPSMPGAKDEVSHQIASQRPLSEIIDFVDSHIRCCKQHR